MNIGLLWLMIIDFYLQGRCLPKQYIYVNKAGLLMGQFIKISLIRLHGKVTAFKCH